MNMKLQKQSKKGFTLVELVVVIAIIAIISAIAIPSVIFMVSAATDSSGKTNASSVSEACYNFYTLVKSGTIDSQSKYPDGSLVSVAAAPGSSATTRNIAAKNITVADALKYSGINLPTKDSGGTPVYDSFHYYTGTVSGHNEGEIEYNTGNSLPVGTSELAPTTKLHNLYND
ncbi:MAG: prepilin-type N-terminal cleavage/methylation domain-containing protein [Clostridia bacterium]|nr:prepilin-type N-terminal cleavage/methylation domain-containing protein [Clostridia bacterium]